MSENQGNLEGFDASTVDPDIGMDPIPRGDYIAIATESEFKDTKDKTGKYLQFTWEVVDGEFRKRLVFDRLNLMNSSETAVKIAQATLSAICHAVGVLKPKDSSELHNKPVVIKVELEERNDRPGSFSNRIKKYTAVGGDNKSTTTTETKADDAKKPPWKK